MNCAGRTLRGVPAFGVYLGPIGRSWEAANDSGEVTNADAGDVDVVEASDSDIAVRSGFIGM